MNLPINHFEKLNLKHNPFSILNERERLQTFQPLFNIELLVNEIKNSSSFLISFYGNQGLGKSANLSYLVNHYFPEVIFHQPKIGFKGFINTTDDLLVIDSFQLLSIKNKWHLLRHQRSLIIAFHYAFDVYKFFKSQNFYDNFNFNHQKLTHSDLEIIVKNRIHLSQLNKDIDIPFVTKEALQSLIKKNKNNLRAIFSDLYDEFQNANINSEIISF